MAEATASNGWAEWSRYVLKELERLDGRLEKGHTGIIESKEEIAALSATVTSLLARIGSVCTMTDAAMKQAQKNGREITALGVKAGVWGAAGAAIPVIGMLLWQLLAN